MCRWIECTRKTVESKGSDPPSSPSGFPILGLSATEDLTQGR